MTEGFLGQYAVFVVPAYLLTIASFLGLAIYTRQRLKYWKARARDEEQRRRSKA